MTKQANLQQSLTALLQISSGLNNDGGDPRLKRIIHHLLGDVCSLIDQYDISQEEFWQAVNYLHFLGTHQEAALLAAGLGLEHYLDIREDARDQLQGYQGGTPRTIEGPLYVANAPLSDGFARMDEATTQTSRDIPLWLYGKITDINGQPLSGAIVDIWHANTLGNYSYFDKSQSEFNLRRRIRTDAQGRYCARSIVPSGYGCPPDGPTQTLLDKLGRHGNRPAHIHFFISAHGYRHLTSQINLNGDKYLWEDFAFATRDELIANPVIVNDEQICMQRDMPCPHTEIAFDFSLYPSHDAQEEQRIKRVRALEAP